MMNILAGCEDLHLTAKLTQSPQKEVQQNISTWLIKTVEQDQMRLAEGHCACKLPTATTTATPQV